MFNLYRFAVLTLLVLGNPSAYSWCGYELVALSKKAAAEFDIPHERILATIFVESTGNPKAKSSVGCLGLMQVAPATAAWKKMSCIRSEVYSVYLYDPRINVLCGAKYLRYLYNKFNGDWDMVHWAYSYGPARASKLRRDGHKAVDINYVKKIKHALRRVNEACTHNLPLVSL